jgi:hypothetical protein
MTVSSKKLESFPIEEKPVLGKDCLAEANVACKRMYCYIIDE